MTHPTSERLPGERGAAADGSFARAHRELITRRLPLLAIGWLGLGVILRTGLVARSEMSVGPAVVSISLQLAVFALAIVLCRRNPGAPRVLPIALASCMALVVLSAGFFAVVGASVEVLTFVLFMICIASSLAFAWGWRPALALVGVTAGAGSVVLPSLHLFLDPIEVVLEVAIGAGVCVALAEASALSFRRSFDQERARHESARRLAASYDAYRDLADNARDLIYTHDLDSRITYVNDAFARFFGAPASELLGRATIDIVPPDASNPDLTSVIARIVAGEEVPPQVVCVRGPEGRRWLECIISGIREADGTVAGIRGIARDVTARRRAEEALRASLEELRRSEEQLRRLARHQTRIREDERKRLGFDLHDDVCQELIGIGILIASLRSRLEKVAPEMDADLGRIGRYVAEVGEHLRQLARDLRPMLLRDLGLEESLHSLADAMTAGGTPVSTVFPTPVPRLGEGTEIGVYRIAQEAVTNAARHGAARTIRVTLAVRGELLELEVADDGCGFLPTVRWGSEALGLVGMEERALALGGRLELRSAPGQGTSVRLACPVEIRVPASAA